MARTHRSRKIYCTTLLVGGSLWAVAPANAQDPANPTPPPSREALIQKLATQQLAMELRRPQLTLVLIPMSLMETQLNTTPKQQQAVRQVHADLQREIKALLPDPQNPPPPPAPRGTRPFPNIWDRVRERETEASGRINAVLKPDQREAAHKLAKTVLMCLRLDIPPETLDSLSLSDLQKEQLTQIAQTTTMEKDVEFEQAVQNNDHEALRRITASRRQAAQEQARALLNDAQRTVINEWRKANSTKSAFNMP